MMPQVKYTYTPGSIGTIVLVLLCLFLSSCSQPEWAGRFTSQNCMTLEYVEFYQDNTADIKYYGAHTATNHSMQKNGDRFTVNYYTFEFRDGKMYEVAGFDMGCVLVKDTTRGVMDRMLEP